MERATQKGKQIFRRRQGQVTIDQRLNLGVVQGLRTRVGVATARMPPQVAVEMGADVPQLVKEGRQLFVERAFHEPRQVEAEGLSLPADD